MSSRKRKILKKFKLPLIAAGVYLLVILLVIPTFAGDPTPVIAYDFDIYKEIPEFKLPDINKTRIKELNTRYDLDLSIKRLQNYLRTKNPVFADKFFATLIVEEANKNGADYRIIASIMAKESGFCNAPYRTYNCFGWLNGKYYSSFREAFSDIVPRIARIVDAYPLNEASMINLGKRYGAVNYEAWGRGVYRFAIKI